MIDTMIDRSKVPGFAAHRVWIPDETSASGKRSIVYVTERRRRLIGGLLIALALVVMLAIVLTSAPIGLIVIALFIMVPGGAYALGGDSGFYEIAEDGSLGEFLGKAKPDLRSMRGTKVRS
jgi:hypothetical protein